MISVSSVDFQDPLVKPAVTAVTSRDTKDSPGSNLDLEVSTLLALNFIGQIS